VNAVFDRKHVRAAWSGSGPVFSRSTLVPVAGARFDPDPTAAPFTRPRGRGIPRRMWIGCTLGLLCIWATLAPAQEWTPLFNGRDLAGWKVPNPNPFWRVVDGVLVGQNDPALKGNVLWTEKEYRDFELEFEARWDGEIDSGVMLRKPELQLQIGVSRTLKRDMTGSFYTGGSERYPEAGQAKEADKVLKPGQWNAFRLQARGNTFTVWINGRQMVEYTDGRFADPGPIGLQIHAGVDMRIEFRNLRIRELPAAAPSGS